MISEITGWTVVKKGENGEGGVEAVGLWSSSSGSQSSGRRVSA